MKKFTILIIFICLIFSCTTTQDNPITTSQQNTMIRLNGGTFTMGSPANEAERYNDEIQRQISLRSFQMSRYPVTQREYQEIMGTNPSHFKGDNLPVEQVTWFDAIEYCIRRSQREGLTPAYTMTNREPASGYPITNATVTVNWNANGYRLPTEAEWEYACRAGTTTPFNTGNNITTRQANFDVCCCDGGGTTPVGSFPANAWGLHDMHGNVWEWCWDWYGEYQTGAQNNPTGAVSGVFRGGSWGFPGQYLRSAYRGFDRGPGYGGSGLGFRVVTHSSCHQQFISGTID